MEGIDMTRSALYGAILLTSAAVMAVAHTGVENPAVMERMQNMKAMADQMEVLVPMARGAVDFEPHRISEALDALQALASEVPALFHSPEMDPQSEALPNIWENLDDFTAHAADLREVSRAAAVSPVTDSRELLQVVREIGSSCSGCHENYRAEQ